MSKVNFYVLELEADTKCVLIKLFIAGFHVHFYFSYKYKFLVIKIPKSVVRDRIGDGQSTFVWGGRVVM
jgi:hypothetical protein